MSEIVELCRHVRARCKRAQPVPGRFYRGMQIVVCPTWEEKEKLEGKGVLALHADELEIIATSGDLAGEEKTFIADTMLRFPGIRLLGIETETEQEG